MSALTANRPAQARVDWGKWGVRSAAFSYLALMLIIPLLVIFQDGLREGLSGLWYQVTLPAAGHALKLTLWTAAVMTVINAVMGLMTAFVLVRYNFPGRALLNAIVDLPLAIPTLVTGVMLVILFGPQEALGAWLQETLGIRVILAPPPIPIALLFIAWPLWVRGVHTAWLRLHREREDAAATLAAGPWTIARRVSPPPLLLPLLSSALLSFARAIGEFGAI